MIYVIETGCRYEGGGADSATTSLSAAFKRARELRIVIESEKIGNHERQILRPSGRLFWVGDFDYVCIREFEELK